MKWRAYSAIYWKATFVSCNREDKMKFYRKMREAIYVWWTQTEIANMAAMVRFVGPWKAVKFYTAHRSRR